MTDARASNRASMPIMAQAMDDFRRIFGPGVKLRYAKEGDEERGSRAEYDEAQAELEAGRGR